MISCRNCGAMLPGDQRFCTRCGQQLGSNDLSGLTFVADPPTRSSHKVAITLAALVLVAVVVGGAWVVAGSGPSRISGSGSAAAAASPIAHSTPTPDPSDPAGSAPSSPTATDTQAASEARAVDTLLDESSRSRRVITPELSALTKGCDKVDPATAVSDLKTAIHDRTDVLRQLPALPMSAIPTGPTLRQRLTRAMTASVQADRDYLRWVQLLASSGCTSSDHSGLVAGNSVSARKATPAKRAFVSMWNPLAKKYGLPRRADSDL